MLKKLSLGVFSAVLVISGCAGVHRSADSSASQMGGSDQVIKSPNDQREYATIKLKNGLTAVLVSDPTSEKSAAALSVGVGLLKDPMTQQGMAHYLEHMLFLGTDRFPDTKGYNEFMTKNGGSSNAYTWLDITNYMFRINNDAYPEALDRFSDFFKAPKLYAEYTEKEKNAVNAEWSMRREMDFFGRFKLGRSMFGDHPANRFLIGNLETLSDKPNAKLHPQTVAFFNKYYSANIMKVAMVSNRPLAEMKKLAKTYFSGIKNKQIDKPKVTKKLNFANIGGKRIHYVPNEDVKQLILDFTIENNLAQYESKPNRFVSYLIGSEMPGTPAYLLKKMGLASSLNVDSSPDMYGNYGSFTVEINLTDAGMQQREAITQMVMQYIDMVRKHGVDKKYFKEIKTSLNNRFRFLEKGDPFNYVSQLSAALQQYPAKDVIAAPYVFRHFDEQAIKQVLAQLTPERLRVWYISKQEPAEKELHFYGGKYKIVDISQNEKASWAQPPKIAMSLPAVNQLLPESFALKTLELATQEKPLKVHDEAGLEVWHLPSKNYRNQPKGVLKVYINNPQNLVSAKAVVMLSLWNNLYRIQQSALQTEASIAGMNAFMRSANGVELTISGFTDKQAELLKRSLAAMRIELDEQKFAQAIDRYTRGIANSEKQFPLNQLFGFYSDVLNADGYNHQQLIDTAKSLKPADLREFIDQVLSNNHVRMFAFGNYDKADVEKFVALVKASLPDARKVTGWEKSKAWLPQTGKALVFRADLPVADVGLLDVVVHPQAGPVQVARSQILSRHMRTAAFDKLRTEEQLAYGVGAFASRIKQYPVLGLYIQTPVKDVKSMQQRFDKFKQEYKGMLDTLSPADFDKIKQSVLLKLKEKPKNLSEEVSPILNDWYDEKWSFDSRAKLIDAVEQVSLEQIKQFYAETMLNQDAARISVQLRGQKFADKPFAKIKGATDVSQLQKAHKKMKFQQ